MDRLETGLGKISKSGIDLFTFQYGQIRNDIINYILFKIESIYIPVWIDQKL